MAVGGVVNGATVTAGRASKVLSSPGPVSSTVEGELIPMHH